MSARQRMYASFKNYLILVGIALIITVGFPLIAEYADVAPEDISGLATLEAGGFYVLRAAPIILILLFLLNLFSVKYKQKKINTSMEQSGITYLMMPRADGEAVRIEQVTLWHRIAQALPYYDHICFEMTGGEDEIVFSLRATNEDAAKNILSKIIAEWPGTMMRKAKQDPIPDKAYFVEVKAIKKDMPIVASTPDPMKALLAEIAILPKGIKAGLQIFVREDPYTRMKLLRKADKKTRKKPESKMNILVVSDDKKNPYSNNLSAEDRRKVQWLDQRAQEAFVEVRLIVWATCDSDEIARRTVKELAKSLSSQYHPNNKLLKGWRIKTGNVRARTFPTFSGRPWVASELGTIAHLVGKDALLSAPQLVTAPARPLPASTECRITENVRASYYFFPPEEALLPDALVIEIQEDEDEDEDLPDIYIENEDDLPTIIIEDKDSFWMLS